MTDEKWEEKRPTIEGLREMGETFLAMYAINLWDLTVRLENALDKACDLLNVAITNEYHSINKECNLIETHVEPFMTIKEWKEWCMKDE